jgi:hypothetical protein
MVSLSLDVVEAGSVLFIIVSAVLLSFEELG